METEKTKYCIYCDTEVETIDAPAIDDDDEWERIAAEHNPD